MRETISFHPGRDGRPIARAADGRVILPARGWQVEFERLYAVQLDLAGSGRAYIAKPVPPRVEVDDRGRLCLYGAGETVPTNRLSAEETIRRLPQLPEPLAEQVRARLTCSHCGRLAAEVPERLGRCHECAEQDNARRQAELSAERAAAEQAARAAIPRPERLPAAYQKPQLPPRPTLLPVTYTDRETFDPRTQYQVAIPHALHPRSAPGKADWIITTYYGFVECQIHGRLQLELSSRPERLACPACMAEWRRAAMRSAVWLSQQDVRRAIEAARDEQPQYAAEAVRRALRQLAKERRRRVVS